MKLKRQKIASNQHQTITPFVVPQEPTASTNRSYSFEIHNPSIQPDSIRDDRDTPQPIDESFGDDQRYKQPELPTFVAKASNPGYQRRLLPKARMDMTACKAQIEQVIRDVEALYQQGPIVEGWLESYQPSVANGGEPIDYVEQTYDTDGNAICESPRPGYRLCGIDGFGQKWSYPCPVDQLAGVSMGIARHQKLQYLLARKRYLEAFLTRLQERDKRLGL